MEEKDRSLRPKGVATLRGQVAQSGRRPALQTGLNPRSDLDKVTNEQRTLPARPPDVATARSLPGWPAHCDTTVQRLYLTSIFEFLHSLSPRNDPGSTMRLVRHVRNNRFGLRGRRRRVRSADFLRAHAPQPCPFSVCIGAMLDSRKRRVLAGHRLGIWGGAPWRDKGRELAIRGKTHLVVLHGLHSAATFRRVVPPDLRGRMGVGVAPVDGPDRKGRGRQGPAVGDDPMRPIVFSTNCSSRAPCPLRESIAHFHDYLMIECRHFAISLMHLSRIWAAGLPNPRPGKQIKKSKKSGFCAQPTISRVSTVETGDVRREVPGVLCQRILPGNPSYCV